MTETALFNRLLAMEDEMVEQYLDDDIPKSDRAEFENSFLRTPDGSSQLFFARILRSYASKEKPSRGRQASMLRQLLPRKRAAVYFSRMAAGGILLLGLGLAFWMLPHRSEIDKGLAALAKAYEYQRPLEARLSGFSYAPVLDSRGPGQQVDQKSRDRAEAILLNSAFQRPDSASWYALGTLYLTGQQFDKALARFETALETDPDNARLHNDYGAALLERGKPDQSSDAVRNLEDLAKALDHFDRALELDSRMAEALFNRALCEQHLMLLREAESDWRPYLALDSTSRWADEARLRLSMIEESSRTISDDGADSLASFLEAYHSGDEAKAWSIIRRNREMITGKLMSWQLTGAALSDAAVGRRTQVEESLRALAFAGKLELQHTGDRYTADLANYYRSSSARKLSSLARARSLVSEGNALWIAGRIDAAVHPYAEAGAILEAAGDAAEAGVVTVLRGYSLQHTGRPAEARPLLIGALKSARAKGYKWLEAFSLTGLGSNEFSFNNYSAAIAFTQQAVDATEQLDDPYDLQRSLSQLANEYKAVGSFDESVATLQRCLNSARSDWPGARQMWRTYDTLAEVLTRVRRYSAAAAYERAALRLAVNDIGDPSMTYQTHLRVGTILGQLQRYEEATTSLQTGYEIARSQSGNEWSLHRAYSALQLGHLYRLSGNFDRSLAYYDEALAITNGSKFEAMNYDLHKGKLLCYSARGDEDPTRSELEIVLRLFEENRSKILEEKNRNPFFDLEQSVYDLAIGFQHARNNDDKAFEYCEASRARSLLDLMSQRGQSDSLEAGFQPLLPAEIRSRLPSGAQIVEYAVLEDRLLICTISSNGISVQSQPIGVAELTRKVLAFRAFISDPYQDLGEEGVNLARQLYDTLIGPIEAGLDRSKQLCLVPDKALNYLPFAALLSDSNEYLASRFRLSLSPSATVFILKYEEALKKENTRAERIVCVGNPRFNRKAAPLLPDLPDAAQEAIDVADLYSPAARPLIAEAALKENVLNELGRCDVAHIASHYVVNEGHPLMSRLLLAGGQGESLEGSGDGVLQASDIYRKKMPRLRLVVLSACRTGVERYYAGEGMVGMARTFLASGVPLVVASLWPVDSQSTAYLMKRFHSHRKAGASTCEALHLMQQEMIADPEQRKRPGRWAAFVVIGGYAKF